MHDSDAKMAEVENATVLIMKFLEEHVGRVIKMSPPERARWWLGVLTPCIGMAMETSGWQSTTAMVNTIMRGWLEDENNQ